MSDIVFANSQVRHLFPTPLIISEIPADTAGPLNQRLKDMILAQEKSMPSARASNYGGWQSNDKILSWGGADVAAVVAALRMLADRLTVQVNREAGQQGPLPWKIDGWANINRRGDSNVPHIHPGAYWSAVYYVAIDDADNPAIGGAFKVMDPRGGLPLMYAPTLRVGLEGHLSAGTAELHQPRAGQCVLFPSWLSHAVGAYRGDGTRISLAFNFSL